MKNERVFFVTTESAGNETVNRSATSDFNTLGLDLSDMNGSWLLQVSRSASDGTPDFTIQVSNDNSNWVDYDERSSNVAPPEIIIDTKFVPKYMRIVWDSNSATGTVTMKLYIL